MHEPRGIARPIAPPRGLGGDSEELTAINDKPPPPNALPTALQPALQPALQIEASRGRSGDDDPTRLMVRDQVAGKADPTSLGFGAGRTPAGDLKPSGGRELASSAADTKVDPPTMPPAAPRNGRGLIIASVILLVMSAGAAGLYFSGLLG
jgi:hypothetical protein